MVQDDIISLRESCDLSGYDTCLFDLDGTLSDPEEGITNGIAYALSTYGIMETDKQVFRSCIGPPLHSMLKSHCQLENKQIQ